MLLSATTPRFFAPAAVLLALVALAPSAASARDAVRQRQLLHAVVQDQVDVVRALLAAGDVDPNARTAPDAEDAWAVAGRGDDADPSPPLFVLACRFGSTRGPEVIRLLLDNGADVNRSDRAGVTPLMAAAEIGGGSVPLLLERGARVDARDGQGRTALMYAMNNRGEGTAGLLLDRGANVNARDAAGETPLLYAIRRAAHDPIRLFGEDLTRKAKEEAARYGGLICYLIERGARERPGEIRRHPAVARARRPPR